MKKIQINTCLALLMLGLTGVTRQLFAADAPDAALQTKIDAELNLLANLSVTFGHALMKLIARGRSFQ